MMAAKLSFRWPQCARTDLKKIIHSSNSDGINLITATLSWNPTHRPNAVQVRFVFRFDPFSHILLDEFSV